MFNSAAVLLITTVKHKEGEFEAFSERWKGWNAAQSSSKHTGSSQRAIWKWMFCISCKSPHVFSTCEHKSLTQTSVKKKNTYNLLYQSKQTQEKRWKSLFFGFSLHIRKKNIWILLNKIIKWMWQRSNRYNSNISFNLLYKKKKKKKGRRGTLM